MLVSLSNVMGSIIIEERLHDLLMATYEIPRVLSFVPISIIPVRTDQKKHLLHKARNEGELSDLATL